MIFASDVISGRPKIAGSVMMHKIAIYSMSTSRRHTRDLKSPVSIVRVKNRDRHRKCRSRDIGEVIVEVGKDTIKTVKVTNVNRSSR